MDRGGRKLQQIREQSTSRAIAIAKPAGPDFLLRRTTQLVKIKTQNVWVLHKQLAVRLIALLLVAALGTVLIANRQNIANYAADFVARSSTVFAQAGLSVAELSLSGYALTSEDLLFETVGLQANPSLVNFDAVTARERLEALPSIETATIRKIYPNSLIVELVEKHPVAIWTVDGVNFAIDAKGERIAPVSAMIEGLPQFIGDGAADDVPAMISTMAEFPTLQEGLLASSRIGDRRWDLIYDSGMRIMLPEANVVAALTSVADLDQRYDIFLRDIELLDMRLNDYVAVRLTDRTPPVENTGDNE